MTKYTVIWRLDGDFLFTELELEAPLEESIQWVEQALAKEYPDHDEQQILRQSMHEYGYELLVVTKGDVTYVPI